METTTDYTFNCPVPIGLAIGIIILTLFLLNCFRVGGDLCSCFSCLLNELLLGSFFLGSSFPDLTTKKKPFLPSDTFSCTAEPPPLPPPVSKAGAVDRPKDMMKLTRREVEMVMDRLGMFPGGEQLAFEEEEKIDIVCCEEMRSVFDEEEPSLGEVKEAFDVFDRNGDGYIDAAELRRVLCALGVKQVSERECRRLIRAYGDEDNIDGRIDFKEFVKLVEKSFSIPE